MGREVAQKLQKVYNDFIRVNEWFPISAGLAEPLRAVGNIFFNGNWKDAVWKMGRFIGAEALGGVYKIYVKLGSPRQIIDRIGRVMSAYFSNSEMEVTSDGKWYIIEKDWFIFWLSRLKPTTINYR
jgi:hypothetical protein